MAYESELEKQIADIISDEFNDQDISWAVIDAAAKRIFELVDEKINAGREPNY